MYVLLLYTITVALLLVLLLVLVLALLLLLVLKTCFKIISILSRKKPSWYKDIECPSYSLLTFQLRVNETWRISLKIEHFRL